MSNENMIPEGYYPATVTGEVEYGNGQKGEQVAIQLEIELPDGIRVAWTKLFFSPDAQQYAMERLEAIGWKGGPIERTKGAKCRVGVKHESYEKDGERKTAAKVTIVTGGGFKFDRPLDDNQKASFLQRLSQYKPPTGGAPAPRQNGGGGGYGKSGHGGSAKHSAPPDDEIPF